MTDYPREFNRHHDGSVENATKYLLGLDAESVVRTLKDFNK